jgi:hypothetical protein
MSAARQEGSSVLAAPLTMLPLIYNMKSRMSYNPLLPNKFQVCKLDVPFQPARKTWVTAVVQHSSSTSAFGPSGDAKLSLPANVYVDGMLRSLLAAARQPSVEDSLGEIQARLVHAGSRMQRRSAGSPLGPSQPLARMMVFASRVDYYETLGGLCYDEKPSAEDRQPSITEQRDATAANQVLSITVPSGFEPLESWSRYSIPCDKQYEYGRP